MNGWGFVGTAIAVTAGYLAWRVNYIRKVLSRANEAWDQTETLLLRRQELAHQIVLYADHTGHWNQELMDRLVDSAGRIKQIKNVPERMRAEHDLSRSIYLAIGFLSKTARSEEKEEILLLTEFWESTEKKIEFAQSYYKETARGLNRRMDRTIARAMVKLRVVQGGQLDLFESARAA